MSFDSALKKAAVHPLSPQVRSAPKTAAPPTAAPRPIAAPSHAAAPAANAKTGPALASLFGHLTDGVGAKNTAPPQQGRPGPSAIPKPLSAAAASPLAQMFAPTNPKLGRLPPPRAGGGGGEPGCQGPPELGTLSARYESNGDPGTVSTGNGDIGGVSYGSYQMSTASGSAGQFVSGSPYAGEFASLQPGTPAFSDKWREIATRDPEGFQAAQHEYIKENYYDVQSGRLQQELGLDVNQHSNALQQVIWSTSVQHGAYSDIVGDALAGQDVGKMSDTDLINAIYAERGRTDENGTLVHFRDSSWDVQQGVANRFRSENTDALGMLQAEQTCGPSSP